MGSSSLAKSGSRVFPLQEPMDVVELFGLKGIQHTPISIKNARVSQVRDPLPLLPWGSSRQGGGSNVQGCSQLSVPPPQSRSTTRPA